MNLDNAMAKLAEALKSGDWHTAAMLAGGVGARVGEDTPDGWDEYEEAADGLTPTDAFKGMAAILYEMAAQVPAEVA